MSLRTRRICVASIVTVSWRATASSSTVESSTRRYQRAMTLVWAITTRMALKIRSGSSLARSLLRHNVNTVGWNASSVNASPAAAFPSDVGLQRPTGLAVRTALKRLQHHHGRDHPSPRGRVPMGTGPRTSHPGIGAGGGPPRTRAPTPRRAGGCTTQPRQATPGLDATTPAHPRFTSPATKTRAPAARLLSSLLGEAHQRRSA
jgi:hypothetical protein